MSGATGGVGSVAIQSFHKIGYENITAIVRKEKQIAIAIKLVTKRTFVYENGNMEWVDGNFGSKLTMQYSKCVLLGEGA